MYFIIAILHYKMQGKRCENREHKFPPPKITIQPAHKFANIVPYY
jgi:hypothetical protein